MLINYKEHKTKTRLFINDCSTIIEILKTYPSDSLVLTEGYENGYESIKKVELIKVEENKSKEWWDGRYNKVEKGLEVVFLDAETKKT